MLDKAITPELLKIAEDELNEDPLRRSDSLVHLREWLKKQPHLTVRDDDASLLVFLRGCKFNLQRTQDKLDFYYTAKTIVTEFFSNRDPYDPEIQKLLKAGGILPLPNRESPTSPRIILVRFSNLKPTEISYITIVKVYFMVLEVLLQEDSASHIAGVIVWCDAQNSDASYLLQISPTLLKKSNQLIFKGYPFRVKGVINTSCPSIGEYVFNLSKTFFSEKIRNRMHMFSEFSDTKFLKLIPKVLHPKEFGGNNGSFSELSVAWKEKVESYKNWFLEDAKYETKEELRIGTPKTCTDVFGVEGTFRQLHID